MKTRRNIETWFVQLLRIALGNAGQLAGFPSPEEWRQLMAMAMSHGVLGILFSGVEKMSQAQRPPLDVLMDWAAATSYIERQNKRLNRLCVQVCHDYEKAGHQVCVLKGQGLAILYPQPMRRMHGDIDVWMRGGKEQVETYVRQCYNNTDTGDGTHHISYHLEGVEVEVHHLPASLYHPRHHRYLLRYFDEVAAQPWTTTVALSDVPPSAFSSFSSVSPDSEEGTIVVPSPTFNLVFVLVHLFHHWAFEGCGMKQLIDYYWLTASVKRVDAASKAEALRRIQRLGLSSFLAAMMSVFRTLGMDESLLLCPPDDHLGDLLLADILTTGIVTPEDLASGKYARETKLRKFVRRLCRTLRLLPLAPTEMPWVLGRSVYLWLKFQVF